MNARYLAEAEGQGLLGATGRHPRGYSIFGAFARSYLVAFVTLAIVLAVFLVLR